MGLVGRALRVRPGEGRTVVLGTAMMLAAEAGGAFGQSGVDALFFARSGTGRLAEAVVVSGVLMAVTALAATALVGRVARQRLFVALPVAMAVVLLVGRGVLAAGPSWIYAVLWLTAWVVQFVQALSTWGLAGVVVDTRQAKRLFPLLAAGRILGAVAGGLLTRPLAALVGAENLLFVWAAGLLLAALAGRVLVGGAASAAARRTPYDRAGPLHDLREGFRFVRRSPLMTWLAVAAFLLSVLFYLLYLPFSRAATARFPDPDALAGFLGLFWAGTAAGGFVVSLLVSNRLLARFGVTAMVAVLPLIYLLGFGTLVVDDAFAVLVAIRLVQMVWLSGVAGPAWEAVINVVPSARRDQARAVVNGVASQAGTVVGGLVQVVVPAGLDARYLYAVGLVAAVATALACRGAHRSYARALLDALRAGRPQVFGCRAENESVFARPAESAAVAAAVAGAADPDPHVRRVAVEILGDLPCAEAPGLLTAAGADADPTVRAIALRSQARAGFPTGRESARRALADPDPDVRLAAVAALEALTPDAPVAALHDGDPRVRAAAAAVVLRRSPSDGGALAALHALLAADDPDERAWALRGAASCGATGLAGAAVRALSDPAPAVRAAAAGASAACDPRSVRPLVRSLSDHDEGVREAAAAALATVDDHGAALLVLRDPAYADGALRTLEKAPDRAGPETLRGYALAESAAAVADLSAARAVDPAGGPPALLLRDSLRSRGRSRAEHALRAVALIKHRAGVRFAVDNLASREPAQVATALEALESLGEAAIVKPLLPLWEPLVPRPAPRSSWLPALLDDPDPWIRTCAAALGGAAVDDAVTTLSGLERVLFLRQVPLFADLSPQDLQRVAEIAREQTYVDGELVAAQGEPGEELHIVVAGAVRVVRRSTAGDTAGGPPVELARRGPGEVVGELALITRDPRMASLLAAGDVRTLRVGRAEFEGVLRERPETAIAVIRILSHRLAEHAAAGP